MEGLFPPVSTSVRVSLTLNACETCVIVFVLVYVSCRRCTPTFRMQMRLPPEVNRAVYVR